MSGTRLQPSGSAPSLLHVVGRCGPDVRTQKARQPVKPWELWQEYPGRRLGWQPPRDLQPVRHKEQLNQTSSSSSKGPLCAHISHPLEPNTTASVRKRLEQARCAAGLLHGSFGREVMVERFKLARASMQETRVCLQKYGDFLTEGDEIRSSPSMETTRCEHISNVSEQCADQFQGERRKNSEDQQIIIDELLARVEQPACARAAGCLCFHGSCACRRELAEERRRLEELSVENFRLSQQAKDAIRSEIVMGKQLVAAQFELANQAKQAIRSEISMGKMLAAAQFELSNAKAGPEHLKGQGPELLRKGKNDVASQTPISHPRPKLVHSPLSSSTRAPQPALKAVAAAEDAKYPNLFGEQLAAAQKELSKTRKDLELSSLTELSKAKAQLELLRASI